jgi:hypothetical protein
MKPNCTDLLRYALWLGVVGTANANRKYYGLPTTWVFHLTLNSLLLFLPELYRGASKLWRFDARARYQRDVISAVHGMIQDTMVNNPQYALYVSPVPLAYIVSHPKFNIYKGHLAELRLFGFGLDAIPHSATAFGFATFVMEALHALRRHAPQEARWYPYAARADQHSAVIAGALLASASAVYESGEYAIHEEELRETGGDITKINLVWSAQDTLFDLMSNTMGWLAAVLVRARKRKHDRALARGKTTVTAPTPISAPHP